MNAPMVYEKRVSHIEAWQWDGSIECADLIVDWVESNGGFAAQHPYEDLIVLGHDIAAVKPTDWIVRDKFNEFWPLADAVFPSVYRSLLER